MAFGKRKRTTKKEEEINEKRLWVARLELVTKMARKFEEEKDTIKIWKARNIDMLLTYNEETMGKEIPTPEVELLRAVKQEVIDELLKDVSQFPNYIPWEIYMSVVEKVMKQGKGVMRDFIDSGPAFKVAVFVILNRIYRNKEKPAVFSLTYLIKLWKKKGSISDLANHRFIHQRHWLAKLFEKCLVAIITPDQERATPEFQMGGVRGHSTREHLLAAIVLMRSFADKGKAVPFVLVDVKKCFDKVHLTDLVFDYILTGVTGADLRVIKALKTFHEDFRIVMAEDAGKQSPKSRVIPNTVGQGTNAAPGFAGNGQAQSLVSNLDFGLCANIDGVATYPHLFVDDVMVVAANRRRTSSRTPGSIKAKIDQYVVGQPQEEDPGPLDPWGLSYSHLN